MEQITIKEIEKMGSDSLKVFGGNFEGGKNIQQVPGEISPCINHILKSGKKINNFLEIGSAAGGNTFLFNHVFQLKNIAIIDDNKHPKHTLRPDTLKEIKSNVMEHIGDSKSKEAIDFIKQLDIKFDIIFIDGDHSHDGVVSDIDNYSRFLSDSGFLILHDTVACFGVNRAFEWLKNKEQYESFEFISRSNIKCGIGLLQKIGEVKIEQKVSIIIPVIRTEGADKCREAIIKNAGVPADKYEIISMQDVGGIGCPAMVKQLVAHTSHDLVMFLGDDTIPEKGFLKHSIEAMESLPGGWGVVGLNTQDINTPNGNPLAHWMAHKEILNYIEGKSFFPTDYEHCYCDNELKDIADELGRWVYADKSLITHNHPINKTAEYDEGYQQAYDGGKVQRDFSTYCRRKRERIARVYGTKLAIAVPLTDDKVYNQFLFSFVKVVTEYKGNADVIFPDFPGQIDAIRNNLVQQALNLGCTHIIMMDSDQIYVTDNLIEQMLAHDKPVVGARVHRRYPPFDPLLLMGEVGKLSQLPDGKIIDENGDFKKEVEVDYTGTGCVLYDMKIFNDMIPEKWFEFITGEQGQPIGEDINFCTKLKKAGIKIVVDCSIDIKHLTLIAADWGTHKLFSKIMGGKKNGKRK